MSSKKYKEITYDQSKESILSFINESKETYAEYWSSDGDIRYVVSEKFEEIDFSNISIQSIIFTDCTFDNCGFFNTRIFHCLFIDCKFNQCQFIHTSIDTTYIGPSRAHTSIEDIGFFNSRLMRNTIFESAISGISISECTIYNCNIVGTILGAGTIDFSDKIHHVSVLYKIGIVKRSYLYKNMARSINIYVSDISNCNFTNDNIGISISANSIRLNDLSHCNIARLVKEGKSDNRLCSTRDNYMSNTTFDNTDNFDYKDLELNSIYKLPSGDIIGWKVVLEIDDISCDRSDSKLYIIKLQIPTSAKRNTVSGLKCRCEYAKVLRIYSLDEKRDVDQVTSIRFLAPVVDGRTINSKNVQYTTYTKGEIVYPDSYDENIFAECSNGIHFFTSIEQAIQYATGYGIYNYIDSTDRLGVGMDKMINSIKKHFRIKE